MPTALKTWRSAALGLMVSAVLLSDAAVGQTGGVLGRSEDRVATPGSGYVLNTRPGQATTRISVWGSVLRPGVYDVGPDFDLASVIAHAGGPRELGMAERNLRLVTQVYRDGQPIFSGPADASGLDAATLPSMRDGDVVVILPDRSVRVNVWGSVVSPGLVVLGPEDTVRDAISLAGGPDVATIRGNATRTIQLSVTRGATGDVLYEGLLSDLPIETDQAGLTDGDILEVVVRERAGWEVRDTLSVAGIAISSVIAVTQVIRTLRN